MALGNKLTKGSVVVRGLVVEHHKTNLFATHVYKCDRKIAVGLYCSVLFFIRVFLRGFFYPCGTCLVILFFSKAHLCGPARAAWTSRLSGLGLLSGFPYTSS